MLYVFCTKIASFWIIVFLRVFLQCVIGRIEVPRLGRIFQHVFVYTWNKFMPDMSPLRLKKVG